MDDLEHPCILAHFSSMPMLSFNLFFSNALINDYKTQFIRRARESVSEIVHELGSKSKNYYLMSCTRFCKLYNELKDKICNKECNVSRQRRKKWKLNHIIVCALKQIIASFCRGVTFGHSASACRESF